MSMRTILAGLLTAATLAAGCGADDGTDGDGGGGLSVPSTPQTDLVLEVDRVPAGPRAHALPSAPSIAVYADGVVLVPAPQIEIYPSPALPGFSEARISPEEVERILDRVRDSGALEYDEEPAPDAGTVVVTVVLDGERHLVRLQEGGPGAAVVDRLLAELPIVGDRLYEPHALAVVARAPTDEGDPAVRPLQKLDWPSTPLAAGCSVVPEADLDRALAAAGQANELTLWQSGGASWQLTFRPLLPHEESCADVGL